ASLDRRARADVGHGHPREARRGAGRLMERLQTRPAAWLGPVWGPHVSVTPVSRALILAIVLPLMGCVAYLVLWERKLIGWMQIRLGPNRVGPYGLLQPVADGIKLLLKEIILPSSANKGLYLLAPVVMLMPAL